MAQTEQLTTQISDPEFRHEVIGNIITENDNIQSDLPGTLQLANQLPSIDTDSLNLSHACRLGCGELNELVFLFGEFSQVHVHHGEPVGGLNRFPPAG